MYVSCIFNPWGQNQGVTFPSPFNSTVLSALQNWTKCYAGIALVLYKIEQKWMYQSHGILQLPRSLFRTVVLPLHLHLSNGPILKHCDLPIEDVHWLGLELSSGSTRITSQSITWLGSCTHVLRKETWKTLWNIVLEGNAILYETSPIISST